MLPWSDTARKILVTMQGFRVVGKEHRDAKPKQGRLPPLQNDVGMCNAKPVSKQSMGYSWSRRQPATSSSQTKSSVTTNACSISQRSLLSTSSESSQDHLPSLNCTPVCELSSMGHVETIEGTRKRGNVACAGQQLVGTMTSGPILLLLRNSDTKLSEESNNDLDVGKNHLEPAHGHRSRKLGARILKTFSKPAHRHLLSPPIPVVRERYAKMQEDLAREADVLRSSIEVHKLTIDCGQKLRDAMAKTDIQLHSPLASPISVGSPPNAVSKWPPTKQEITSMINVIQREIDKVESLRDVSQYKGTRTSQMQDHPTSGVGAGVLGAPARLEDVEEKLRVMSYSNAGHEINNSKKQLLRSLPCCRCGIWVDRDESVSNFTKEQCCGGLEHLTGDYCCICAADSCREPSLPWCRHCDGRWKYLQQLEMSLRSRIETPDQIEMFLDSACATRALVGECFQHRLDLILAHTLLQTTDGIQFLATMIRCGGLQFKCGDIKISVFCENGKLDLSIGALARQAAMNEDKRPVKGSRRSIPRGLRITSIAPGISNLDGILTALDVSGQSYLENVPVHELAGMKSLRSFDCCGCPRLKFPPPEVTIQGGVAVLRFLRRALEEGVALRTMNLIVIGTAGTGKTSLIKALSGEGDSETWDLCNEGDGLKFAVEELEGQRLQTFSNQLFFVRRAIYMLVWRVVDRMGTAGENKLRDMTCDLMDALHHRLGDAHIILVATHADTLPTAEVERQVKWVQDQVQIKLCQMKDQHPDESVLPPFLWNGGESFCVRNLDESGLKRLRAALINMAHRTSWWKEVLPESYLKLREEIAAERNFTQTSILTWDQYAQVALRCGLSDECLDIATSFLHNATDEVKYFGDAEGRKKLEYSMRDQIIFVNKFWMRDSINRLVRPDRNLLHTFFFNDESISHQEKDMWLHRVHNLATRGVLHKELALFIWPGGMSPLSKEYWNMVRQDDKSGMCQQHLCKNMEDYDRLICLLLGFDIVHALSDSEYQIPLLLAPSHQDRLDARAYARTDCTVVKVFYFTMIPCGFYEQFLVRLSREYSQMDFNSSCAVFYKFGRKAQIFLTRERIEQVGKATYAFVMRCLATTPKQLQRFEMILSDLALFFAGIRLIRIDEPTSNMLAEEEPIGVRLICSPSSLTSMEYAAYIKRVLQHVQRQETKLSLSTLRIDIGGEVDPKRDRVVLVCIDSWISSSEKGLKQLQAAIGQGIPVIGLICPDYKITNFQSWWPDTMPEMKRYPLFFDCRNMLSNGFQLFADSVQRKDLDKDSLVEERYANLTRKEKEALEAKAAENRGRWFETMQPQLIDKINYYLEAWRGTAPDPDMFGDLSDEITCLQCEQEGSPEPCIFSRRECMSRLKDWQIKENMRRCKLQEVGDDGIATSESYQEVCSNGHSVRIEDFFSGKKVYAAVPCNSCRQGERVPPYCFNREACLQYVKHQAETETMECPLCERTYGKEKSSIHILDLLHAHIYMSYNEGVEETNGVKSSFSTQHVVHSLQTSIMKRTGLVCSFQYTKEQQIRGHGSDGTISSRSDDGSTALQLGLISSTVTMVFLSDAYCNDDSCIREFLYSVNSGKYLIPLLLPSTGAIYDGGPESGWTGLGGNHKLWWQHAATCSSCRDPDTSKTFTWSALSLFEPIDLRGEDALEAATYEIEKQLQALFHHGSPVMQKLHDKYSAWRISQIWERLDSVVCKTFPGIEGMSQTCPANEAVKDHVESTKQRALAMFETLDVDKDHRISEYELSFWGVQGGVPVEEDDFMRMTSRRTSHSTGTNAAPETNKEPTNTTTGFAPLDAAATRDLMAQCDTDKDGYISFPDLWDVLRESIAEIPHPI